MQNKKISPAPYKCITKIGWNPQTGAAVCVKYKVNDLLKYVAWLDVHFPNWTWTNVFAYKGHRNAPEGMKLGNFTKTARPVSRRPF